MKRFSLRVTRHSRSERGVTSSREPTAISVALCVADGETRIDCEIRTVNGKE